MKNRYMIRGLHAFILACSMTLCFFDLSAAVLKQDKIKAADQLLEQNHNIKTKYLFKFGDRFYVGYPNVYSPVIFPGASKQTEIVLQGGEHFLELGCGTGIFSVSAALEGAERVVAIDINPDAELNTRENAHLHVYHRRNV